MASSAIKRYPVPAPERRGRRFRLVDLLRFLLPATALVLTALVVLWPQLMGGYGGLIVPVLTGDGVDVAEVMRMRNPRYVGRTNEAEPYQVTAASAYVDPARPNWIHLERMAADLATEAQRDVRVVALNGLYDRASEQLDLGGGIELQTSDGYHFATESAQLLLQQGRVLGGEPVAGQGPVGTLAADRFEILGNGDILRFEGRVKVTLQPQVTGNAGS